MKNLLKLTIITLLLTSCAPLVFETPMPHSGEEFSTYPKELQGMYVNVDPEQKDTIVIREDKITGVDPEKFIDIESKFKKVIKKSKDKWVFNYSAIDEKDGKGWIPYIAKLNGNKLSLYYLRLDTDENNKEVKNISESDRNRLISEKLKLVKKITSVKTIEGKNGKKDYMVNPSDEEFEKLINSNILFTDGVFEKIK